MLFKVFTCLFFLASCCNATYNTLGTYGTYSRNYGLGFPVQSAYYSPVSIVKAQVPYNLPSLGYNSYNNYNTLPLSKDIYSYPLDLDTFYDSGSLGAIDSGYGAGAYLDKGLYSGNLNYGPSLSLVGKYGLQLKK